MTDAEGARDEAAIDSEIADFYVGTSIFVTGATGFLGKLLVEKLLRTCAGVEKIYVLIREKKGKSIEKRWDEIIENPVFDKVKKQCPKFGEKIELVRGDCVEADFGLSVEDRKKIVDSVGCVFHCAANVRFDEKIRDIAYTNVRATRDILLMSKEMPKLKSLIYLSTAFSHCIRQDIKEQFYQIPINGEKLLALVEASDDDLLEKIKPVLIGKWPNTYAFTKAIAEDVVGSYGKNLPVAVVRPSIVAATFKDPIEGWTDNMYGATGVTFGVGLGLIHTMHIKKECLADTVPADYVINCTIAAAWNVGTKKPEATVPIFNCVTSVQKPITWKQWMDYTEKYLTQVPSRVQVWYDFLFMNSNYCMHMLCIFLFHTIPAHIVDFLARCVGKEPSLVKGYKKINKLIDVLAYFTTRSFLFTNDNTQTLLKKLNATDRKLFDFDVGAFDWDDYFYNFSRGGRVYLFKDPMNTLPEGRVKYLKLQIAHYALVAVLFLISLKVLSCLWSFCLT